MLGAGWACHAEPAPCWLGLSHDLQSTPLPTRPPFPWLQYSATGQLPGASPQLLASLPCCWLLLPGASRQPQPAGALLLSVQLPPRGLNSDAQLLLLGAGMGLESAMRLVVYCPQTGQLLQCREWVQQDEQALYLHPHHRVPTWDSRCVGACLPTLPPSASCPRVSLHCCPQTECACCMVCTARCACNS